MKKRSLVGSILGLIAAGSLLFSGIIELIVYYAHSIAATDVPDIWCIWQPIVFDIAAGVLMLVGAILDLSKPRLGGALISGGTTLVLIGRVLRIVCKDGLSRGFAIGLSWLWFIAFFVGAAAAILSFAHIRPAPEKHLPNNDNRNNNRF